MTDEEIVEILERVVGTLEKMTDVFENMVRRITELEEITKHQLEREKLNAPV